MLWIQPFNKPTEEFDCYPDYSVPEAGFVLSFLVSGRRVVVGVEGLYLTLLPCQIVYITCK